MKTTNGFIVNSCIFPLVSTFVSVRLGTYLEWRSRKVARHVPNRLCRLCCWYQPPDYLRTAGCLYELTFQSISQSIYLSTNAIHTGPDTKGACNLR